jgi:hypothetical protein
MCSSSLFKGWGGVRRDFSQTGGSFFTGIGQLLRWFDTRAFGAESGVSLFSLVFFSILRGKFG